MKSDMTLGYDIIGDIHGHADALVALLEKLGYEKHSRAWRHPERTAVFVGDFIDRGPKQIETVMIAKEMVETGSALAVMGNHEFNAIAWHTPDPAKPGDFLRPHSPVHRDQHAAFLAEVEDKPRLYAEIIEWFLSLPLWLDLSGIRVVHACWHPSLIDYLTPLLLPGTRLSRELMPAAALEPESEEEKDGPEPSLYKAVEALIKGIEAPLPAGYSFRDKCNIRRTRVRIGWWNAQMTTYQAAALLDDELRRTLPELPLPESARVLQAIEVPLVVGHYWFTGTPQLLTDKVACVDYSAGLGGPLCCYRWGGESILDAKHFCWV
jgi:hypothetical protein